MGFIAVGGIVVGDRFIDMPDQQPAAGQAGIVAGVVLAVLDQEELARAGVVS